MLAPAATEIYAIGAKCFFFKFSKKLGETFFLKILTYCNLVAHHQGQHIHRDWVGQIGRDTVTTL